MTKRRYGRSDRRGVLLTEIIVSCFLLAVATAACVQFFGASAAARQALRERDTAIEEAANLMENLAAKPWDGLAAGKSDLALSSQAATMLADGSAHLEIDAVTGPPPARRLTLTLRWKHRDGTPGGPVTLVDWRYR